jgi:bacterioferritin
MIASGWQRDGSLELQGASVIAIAKSIRLACRSDYDVTLPEVDVMELNKTEAVEVLNRIVELELSGAVRYTQYSLMVFGHARIPIMSWMREQAAEALVHATQAGEEVTAMGARISLDIGELAGTHHESVDDIMQELLLHERKGIELYGRLLKLSHDSSISLEEFARQKIRNEEMHVSEIEKMLRRRGDA